MDHNAIAAGANILAGGGCILAAILVLLRRKGIPDGFGLITFALAGVLLFGGLERFIIAAERIAGQISVPENAAPFDIAIVCRIIFAILIWAINYWLIFIDIGPKKVALAAKGYTEGVSNGKSERG